MHTGTCQHVDGVKSGTHEMNRAVRACMNCAEPMNYRGRMTDRPLGGLEVLRDYGQPDGLVKPWPKFTIEGQR
jgi:hypothetical protein